MMNWRALPIVAVLGLLMATAGFNCGAHDVNVGGRIHPANQVYDAPNHFASVVSFCDGHGHRVFETDHGHSGNGGGGLSTIDDASCPGGAR